MTRFSKGNCKNKDPIARLPSATHRDPQRLYISSFLSYNTCFPPQHCSRVHNQFLECYRHISTHVCFSADMPSRVIKSFSLLKEEHEMKASVNLKCLYKEWNPFGGEKKIDQTKDSIEEKMVG